MSTIRVVSLLLVAVLLLGTSTAWAGAGTVTVKLLSSTNAGLAGGNVYYYQGGWQLLGTTDISGTVSGPVPITTDIEIQYVGGRYKWVLVDPATNPTLTMNTVLVTVKLETCGGTALVGEAKYYFNGWTPIGNTPATIELLPYSGLGPGQGNYDFVVKYDGRTSPIYTQDVSVNSVVVFRTTKVSLYGSNVLWYNNGWTAFASPKEVMGGTSNRYGTIAWADFKFNGSGSPTVKLNIDGCILSGGMITLVDEAGNPLANYPADYPGEIRNLKWKYRCGGSWGPETSFKTDANGQTFCSIGCSNWDKKITMTLNQTTKEQDITVNSIFQAAKVNVNLETCNPTTPLSGGVVAQGGGYWYNHGTTGPGGTVSFYTFPSTIKVRMAYNHADETKFPAIVAGTNEVDFTTTRLTLNYSSGVKSNKGGSWWMFSTPTMNLLAGAYSFWFQAGTAWTGPVTVNVSGCDMNKVFLRLLDESNNGVAGGKATPAYGGSWGATLSGQTDGNGILFADITSGFTKIKMTVNQGSQEQTVAQLNASNYTWHTEILRIWLKDNAGSAITDQAGVLDQGGGYWYTWGNFNSSGYRDVQLFPGSYKFRATYNYTAKELFPVVASGAGIQNFDFQTGKVVGPTCTQYSTGAWRTFTNPMQLMPGTYTFVFNDETPNTAFTVLVGQTLTIPAGTYTTPKLQASQEEIPIAFGLSQNYPNPFNPLTTIRVAVPIDASVSLVAYNALGQKVAELMNGTVSAGYHDVLFDASKLSSGLYIYRMIAKGTDGKDFSSVQKMILMK